MPVSYADKQMLASDATFQNRVRQAMVNAAINIENEGETVAFHRERETFGVGLVNAPDTYKMLFAIAVANDANVIADATAGGTVALTTTNVAAQAALVTDPHIDVAISSSYNGFFRTPAS